MAVSEIHAAAGGFDPGAAAYERSRPSYPTSVVEQIAHRGALAPGRRVLDLAAGTGKLTRSLLATGADVVAVEPVAGMRRELVASTPGVQVLDGAAERIPIEDASVDVVTVAQAFHWFDAPRALDEIARVLRPGGAMALLWNERDVRVDWVRVFGDLLVLGEDERPYEWYVGVDYATVIDACGRFGPVETTWLDWSQPVDEDLVVERAASVSVVATLAPEARAAVLDRIRDLCRTHPNLAGRSTWGFPYRTVAYLATLG